MKLELVGVEVRFGVAPAFATGQWSAGAGEFVIVVGPNGAGKSTMLGVLAGLIRPNQGCCRLDGEEARSLPRRRLARRVCFLPQSVDLEFPFRAEQVALMGRAPHLDRLFESAEDLAAGEQAMRLTDTWPLRHRDFRTLSGGEKQRVVLASALAQSPEAMLLDEPATFLDLKHQCAIYKILAGESRQGMLVIAATHDLNLAAAFASRVVVLRQGRIAADGPPKEVLREELLSEVFDVALRVDAEGRVSMRHAG